MSKTYIVPGRRTPFVKAGKEYASLNAIEISKPVIEHMVKSATPDFFAWGQVIPSPSISNLGRELWLEAGLDPSVPAFSTQLACSTSMLATIQASSMLGKGGNHLALVGGVESMSHVPIALKEDVAQNLAFLFQANPAAALKAFQSLQPTDVDLPVKGWANRISGRSMGEHSEDMAQHFDIAREDQDKIAFDSHKCATSAQSAGFFDDLILPFNGVEADTIPRADTSLEKLATLKPVFDRGPNGTLTAGNSSPLTDGAAGLWVADKQGLKDLDASQAVELVDWQIEAMDYRNEEGILMAPARAIPKLLARHGLRLKDVALFEIHEAFAAQLLANVKAVTDSVYRRDKAGVDFDLGDFPWDRLNPNGGSLAIGHPFGATGARILSQTAKELSAYSSGSYALVSICADGGQGTVVLLRKP
jgi:acetyl-CoA C-acetyltransferase/acetyl-CoA acyltransferase